MPLRKGHDLPGPKDIDTTDCENEPIRFPGAIQSHGIILALDKVTDQIVAVSNNIVEFLSLLPHEILGNKLEKLIELQMLNDWWVSHGKSEARCQPKVITLKNKAFFVRGIENETGQILVECELAESQSREFCDTAFELRTKISLLFSMMR